MKILVLSDCHANIDALNAVWEKEHDSDYILFAGDMVDFGFYPKETIRWFMERRHQLYAVRGNHDEYILSCRNDPVPTGTPRNFQELTFSQLTDEEYDFLASLPHETTFTIGDTDFYMCHTTDELSAEIYYPESQLPSGNMRALLLERFAAKFPHSTALKKAVVYGHSHLQWVSSAGENCLVLNPGSLSYRFYSFEPVRCADYMVIEDGNIGLRHVNFDTSHLYKRAEDFEDKEAARLARAFYRREELLW